MGDVRLQWISAAICKGLNTKPSDWDDVYSNSRDVISKFLEKDDVGSVMLLYTAPELLPEEAGPPVDEYEEIEEEVEVTDDEVEEAPKEEAPKADGEAGEEEKKEPAAEGEEKTDPVEGEQKEEKAPEEPEVKPKKMKKIIVKRSVSSRSFFYFSSNAQCT